MTCDAYIESYYCPPGRSKPGPNLRERLYRKLHGKYPEHIVEECTRNQARTRERAAETWRKWLDDKLKRADEEPIPAPDRSPWEAGIDDEIGMALSRPEESDFWFFKGDVYDVSSIRKRQHYTEDQIKLLVIEHFDKERRKFERLMRRHKSDGTDQESNRRSHIPEQVRIAVWRRDGGKCCRCGSRERLEYDHIIPVSKGGGNTERNIELLCERCNRKKSDNIE